MADTIELTIREAIISYCPDAEVFDPITKHYGDVEYGGLGLAPAKVDGKIYDNKPEFWHWAPHSIGHDADVCMKEVLDDISKLKHVSNIKKLYIRSIMVDSEIEFETGLTNYSVVARFSLGLN